MSSDDSEDIKTVSWVGTKYYYLPCELFHSPVTIVFQCELLELDFLVDNFSLYPVKMTDSDLYLYITRLRQSSDNTDNGYFLEFNFTVAGFDEGTKTARLKHDQDFIYVVFNMASALERAAKLGYTNYIYELMVVVKLVELKNLVNDLRDTFENIMFSMKCKCTDRMIDDASYILKRPGLKDFFTGRLSLSTYHSVMELIVKMTKRSAFIAEYLRAKSRGGNESDKFELSRLLNWLAHHQQGPISVDEALFQYMFAHNLGLDFYKTLVSDHLRRIMENKDNIFGIIKLSVNMHDEDMFESVVPGFLKHFKEIVRSEGFQQSVQLEGIVVRHVIHAARIWVLKNGQSFPELDETKLQSPELDETKLQSTEL